MLRNVNLLAHLAVAALALALGSPSALGEDSTAKKKIVFMAGNPSHGYWSHEHRAVCMLLANQLNKTTI